MTYITNTIFQILNKKDKVKAYEASTASTVEGVEAVEASAILYIHVGVWYSLLKNTIH